MQHADGRRSGRRRILVAVAHDGDDARRRPGRHRARELRRTRRDTGPRAGRPQPSGTSTSATAEAPPWRPAPGSRRPASSSRAGWAPQGVVAVGSDDRHAQDGRATGRLPDRAEHAARSKAVAMGFVRSNLRGLRTDERPTSRRSACGRTTWTSRACTTSRGRSPSTASRSSTTASARTSRATAVWSTSPARRCTRIRVASTVAADQLRRGDRRGTRRRRRDGRRRTELRLGVARPVPDGTRRAARVEDVHLAEHAAAQPVGRGRGNGRGAVPAEPHERRDRNRDRVGVLPERPGAGRREHGEPRHVPGGRRHASVRRQRARVGRREGQQQARRRRGDLRRVGNGLEHAGDPGHDERRAELQHVASLHVGQERAVQLAGEHGAERRAGHVLPEQVPRPPGRRAVRLHGRGGQLREARDRVLGRRWTGPTPATASRTRTTSTTPTWGRRRTASPRRCRCTCSARTKGSRCRA